jgi:hypothetical protein
MNHKHSLWHQLRKPLAYAAAVGTCLIVFAAYLQPEFMMTLANQIWACF